MFARLALAAVAAVSTAAPAFAQKKPELGNFPFWTAPKAPHAHAFVPGLAAALELTPEQIEKIRAAMAETVNSAELAKLPRKGGPNAKPEEIAAAGEKRAAAAEKLHQMVADVLTKEQKAMIEKMNDAYARVVADVGSDYQEKFAAAKGNAEDTARLRKEQQEAIAEAYMKKIAGMLTVEQVRAIEKAADEEKKRAAAAKDKPKPGK